MPCFTAFRVRVFTECLHAYAFDVALKTSREHAFLKDLLELFHSRSRKHGTHACRKQFDVSFGT